MNKRIGILHLEDSLKDSELIKALIENAGIGHEYFLADNEKDFLRILGKGNIDIILSDYSLPDYNGNEALQVAREKYSHIPFIFVSGTIGEDAAINALLNGATDYVLKNKLERLVPAIKRALHEHELEIKHNQAETDLKKSEELFKAIFNDAPMGIALVDSLTGKLHNVNPMFAKIAGRTIAEMENINWMSITHPDDIQLDLNNMAQLVAGEIDGYQMEKRYILTDGAFVWINMTVSHILYDDESHPRHLAMIEDITERKRAEQKLILANKELAFQNEEKEKRAIELILAKEHAEESDRLKSAFLTNMSHEIRTPMNGILGFAELLREPNLTGDDQQDFISIIVESGNRMLNIIDNIICISKIESKQTEISISETNINEQIKSIYSNFKTEARQKGIEISFKNSLPEEKSMILSDPKIINTIITNLLKNAIKFTNKGQIYFGYIKKGKFLEFFVKDTGVGIGQEHQKIIFEQFRQAGESLSRAYEGAGLGLSISKAYVEMLGGKIWVKSGSKSVNGVRGSKFYFTIPYTTKSELTLS